MFSLISSPDFTGNANVSEPEHKINRTIQRGSNTDTHNLAANNTYKTYKYSAQLALLKD